MKNKLRHLTSATVVLGAAAAAYVVAEPAIDRWRAERQAAAASQEDPRQKQLRRVMAENVTIDAAGDRQLLLAIARLEQRGSVTARLQHRAFIDGLELEGRGEYLQQGRGTHRHVRWLLESQHDGVRASLLQSTNGRFLWTDRHIATGRLIERVDLWQVRRMSKLRSGDASSTTENTPAPFLPQLTSSFGGLPMLLESLRTHFEFTAPGTFRAPEHLHLGSQPVIGLIGRWRPESLASIVADVSDLPASKITSETLRAKLERQLVTRDLPTRLPLNVLVLLGQNDLFPYLIEYRAGDDQLADADVPVEALFQLSREPLARLEFYDVVFDRDISTVEFIYSPPDEPDWYDRTDQYVDRIERRQAVQIAQQEGRRVATVRDDQRR